MWRGNWKRKEKKEEGENETGNHLDCPSSMVADWCANVKSSNSRWETRDGMAALRACREKMKMKQRQQRWRKYRERRLLVVSAVERSPRGTKHTVV